MPVKKHKNKQKQTRGKNYELSQKCKFFKSHMYWKSQIKIIKKSWGWLLEMMH